MIHFILGGTKSGKSLYAEQQIMQFSAPWFYLATGQAFDYEMQAKILAHQKRRGRGWQTIEEPLELSKRLKSLDGQVVLIDCLTLWLTNLMMEQRNIDQEIDHLICVLQDFKGEVVLVSNEVGQGIVPSDQLSREFRDVAGVLHQNIAAISHQFTMMVAGYPWVIKAKEGK